MERKHLYANLPKIIEHSKKNEKCIFYQSDEKKKHYRHIETQSILEGPNNSKFKSTLAENAIFFSKMSNIENSKDFISSFEKSKLYLLLKNQMKNRKEIKENFCKMDFKAIKTKRNLAQNPKIDFYNRKKLKRRKFQKINSLQNSEKMHSNAFHKNNFNSNFQRKFGSKVESFEMKKISRRNQSNLLLLIKH